MGIKTAKGAAIGGAVILFCLLYFGFSTTDKTKKARTDRERALTSEVTGTDALMAEAKTRTSSDTIALADDLEHLVQAQAADTAAMLGNLKKLSGIWYNTGEFGLSGFYAQRVAEIEGSADAWSIAGATYNAGITGAIAAKEQEFCTGRAVKAYENAISLEPENASYRVGLATVYAAAPPKDNPMKGIQMLLDLNAKEPDNTQVLNVLGRLAIKTGQYDKAIVRLERSFKIDPANKITACLLSMAFEGAGQLDKAAEFAQKCKG